MVRPIDAVLAPDELKSAPLAYLAYASRLAPPIACAWLTSFLERADWRDHFGEWVNAAGLVVYRAGGAAEDQKRALADAIADKLETQALDPVLHDGLGQLNINDRYLLPALSTARTRITRWIARTGSASDGALMARWIEHAPEGGDIASLVELGRALLERGSSELRRAERAPLAAVLVQAMDRHAHELRVLALRVFIRNERASGSPVRSSSRALDLSGTAFEAVLPAMENALAAGAPASLAVDLAIAIGALATMNFALRNPQLVRVAAALLQHAADEPDAQNQFQTLMSTFEVAIQSDRHGPPLFGNAAALGAAVAAVNHLGSDPDLSEGQRRRLAEWAESVADQHFRMHGLARGPRYTLGAIDRLVGWDVTRISAIASLRRALDAEPASPATEISRRVLDAHPNDSLTALAAFYALPESVERIAISVAGADLVSLQRELGRLLLCPWLDPVAGVDMHRLVGGVRTLELTDMSDDRLCVIAGDAVRFSRSEVAKLVSGERSAQRALAIAALYVTHELVHVAQGAGGKPTIDRLRAAGGETTLLHLDLAADHAAARLVREMNPEWSLVWLKELHGDNASRYPVSRWHIGAARVRKALRLVGLRTDLIVRTARPDLVGDDDYAFADFGPAGGDFVLLASGPPWRVLGITPFSVAEATALSSAADEPTRSTPGQVAPPAPPTLVEIDTALRRLVERATKETK